MDIAKKRQTKDKKMSHYKIGEVQGTLITSRII